MGEPVRDERENRYPLGITVAKAKAVELREEGWLHCDDLSVEL